MIFNRFVGSAAIIEYHKDDGKIEVLRVNEKYLQELGMNLSEKNIIKSDNDNFIDEESKKTYIAMLDRSINSRDEEECVTVRIIKSSCCREETMYIRSNVKLIGSLGNRFIFYETIRNITDEKRVYQDMIDSERQFKAVAEQVNVYFWEYTIATKEMRPCFRCMRDLGLPPLLKNYPDSAIERGIFPPEVADMYRDWHIRIAAGEKSLEAIIPLLEDRIPFRVRYTTEFDENGNPVKAYGSAELIV